MTTLIRVLRMAAALAAVGLALGFFSATTALGEHHEKGEANPCKAANPCAKKAENPCAEKKANPCNPCNPCAKKNPCSDKK